MRCELFYSARHHRSLMPKRSICTMVALLVVASTALAQTPINHTPENASKEADLPNGAKPEISISDRGRVRLHVADVDLSTVLTLLSVQSQRNIITSPNVSGKVTAHLYDVSFDEALKAILIPNDADYRQSGSFIYIYTKDELTQFANEKTEQPITQIFRLNYITAADAETYIAPILSSTGKIVASVGAAVGVSTSAGDGGGNTYSAQDFILVIDTPTVIKTVEKVINNIDVRPQQVIIEATILRAQLNDDNALGIDFSLVGGVDLELLGGASLGLQNISLGALPQDRFERFNAAASTDFAGDVPSGGISIGILKDQVAVFLRALEQVTDTTVLANPKVLALNKQRGQVIVGRRDGFLTTTVTQTQAIQTVEFLETGTQLIFRPYIADDGYIRVELHPEDSVGFVNAQGLPSEQTTEVTTNVIMLDGETILIGGLFREVTTDSRNQVPFMGNIPGFGPLFRYTNDTTAREEVIILLTLHIVKNHAAYAQASLETKEDIDRLRVGMRRGLMWSGRDRLAQSHYHKATEYYIAGDIEQAQWHLDMALHNSSRMLPAIQLKERILKQREWDHESTIIRSFVYHLIDSNKNQPQPPCGRPTLPPVDSLNQNAVDQTDQDNKGS